MARNVVGKKIEELREGRGWTQTQLVEELMAKTPGQKMNTIMATFNQLENSRRSMSAKYAIMLAKVFPEVTAKELLEMQLQLDLTEAEEELALEATQAL